MKSSHLFLAVVALCLAGSSVSRAENIVKGYPVISNPSFSFIMPDKKLEVNFDYSSVAGDISDAELKLVIFVANGIDPESYHPLRLGLKRVLQRTGDYADSKETMTRGRLKFVLQIPEEFEIIGKDEISGFRMQLKDALGRESPFVHFEVKIQEKRAI
jgi:hypothetical protein